MPLSRLWIWTPEFGIKVLRDFRPKDCEEAKFQASPALSKAGNEDALCCHLSNIETGRGDGEISLFLVWVCEDYQPLAHFLETAASTRRGHALGHVTPPWASKPAW